MVAADSFETLVSNCKTTRRHVPEGNNSLTRRLDNCQSQTVNLFEQ